MPTEEQRKRAFEAAGLTSGQQANVEAGVLDSSLLSPSSSVNFQSPSYPSEERASSVEVPQPTTPTDSENQYENFFKQLQDVQTSISDEGAFRAEQERVSGVEEQETALGDLTTRLRDLQRKETAIPLILQEQSKGQGITAGGLAPIEAGELRKNAIEALTVSSLIDATSNRLVSAQRKVERAVQAKFGPLLAEKNAIIQNLDLVLKSPKYSREEKDRAEAQRVRQENETRLLEQQKEDQTKIWTAAVEAAKNGANTVILEKIQNAQTPEEALKISVSGGFAVPKEALPASAQEYNFAVKNGYKGTYTDYQNEDANRKKAIAAAGVAGQLTPSQVNASFKLADDYEKASKDFDTVVQSFNRIEASAASPSAAGDLSLIFAYMKMLDPTSVVREGEFATAQNSGSVEEGIISRYNKVRSGQRLTETIRKDFLDRARKIYESSQSQQDKVDKTYSDRAKNFGIPPSYVVRDRGAVRDEYNGVKLPGESGPTGSNYNGITLPY